MSRNNEKNIKKHNDKLHKAHAKAKKAEVVRKQKLTAIARKFNETKNKMPESHCYCGSSNPFSSCCEPYLNKSQKASTAEALMRSRYSAYCTQAADYLVETTHATTRKFHLKKDILEWSEANQWLKLEVLHATETTVAFKAYFLDKRLKATVHHEKSTFVNENGSWFYVDGRFY